MQTERVTFLTTPDHKAALDAFASSHGRSVGHVVREATASYMAPTRSDSEVERELELLLPQAEADIAEMIDDVAAMREMIAETRAAIAEVLEGDRARS